MAKLYCTLIFFFLRTVVCHGQEGDLESFERHAIRAKPSSPHKKTSRKPKPKTQYIFNERADESLFESALYMGGIALVAGGSQAEVIADERETWSPVVSVARMGAGYQWADEGVSAWDVGGAFGRGVIAVGGRHTIFREEGEVDDLRFTQAHLFYRMAILSHIEIGLGFGAAWLNGTKSETGFSFALPFRWWPVQWGGVEIRPAWTWFNDIRLSDIETAAVVRYKGTYLRAGYRWLEIEDDRGDLSGFRVGVGLRY